MKNVMKNSFGLLQRIGRAFMLPIALLPVAGLLLGVGSSLTNPYTVETYHLTSILGEGTLLNGILTLMSFAGQAVFNNLPLLFALGIALGLAKKEHGTAVLAAAIGFLIMHTTISALLTLTKTIEDNSLPDGSITSVCGITSLEMGVFGGIIAGLVTAYLHNRFCEIRLPSVLSFFGGTRFVPIITALSFLPLGALLFFVWPYLQKGIFSLGELVLRSGYAGTFLYGLIERALIPFGLHHVFYLPFWQTGVGGTALIDGVLVSGAQNIFFAELASPNTQVFSVSATRFMSGKFPFMIFGLPGAALAMYQTAKPERKKLAGGLLLSAALTSVLTGITEPLEFTFLFVAPLLYVIHCILAGLSYMLMHIFNVGVGMTFSGGLIDLFLFGILQGNQKTHWSMIVVVGICYFILYFVIFRFLILRFQYKTPGREEENEETKLYTRSDYQKKKEKDPDLSETIVVGLGGKENLESVSCCATRLRITVKNPDLVQEGLLKSTGAAGVIRSGTGVQVVYGPGVNLIKSKLDDYLSKEESE